MNRKNLFLVMIGIILLVVIYFAYKSFYLYYYNIDYITTENYDNFIKGLTIKNEMIIRKKSVNDNNYLEYNQIKIRNDFKNFEKVEPTTTETSLKLVLKDENQKVKASFWMGQGETYINLLKTDKTLFGTENKKITNNDLSHFLKKNNINNDIELLQYLEKKKQLHNNIFTSVKQMKENYEFQFMAAVILPVIDNITLIKGDYEGYILNMKNAKEVSILKNNKRYIFMFIKTDYFTDQYINELLNTIEI